MDQLYWPLTVLSRSIHYRNLTGASQHVGLSQPQLSRIIKQLEEEMGVILLDRTSPRHSSWTPEARKLAEIFTNSTRALSSTLQEFQEGSEQKQIYIGCLEGLSILAKEYVNHIFTNSGVETVYLNVYDLNQLESKFLSTDLDLIFSSRSPGTKKYEFTSVLGYQTFESRGEIKDLNILSPYEFSSKKKKEKNKVLISNSLQVRRSYAESFGGKVQLPSDIKNKKPVSGAVSVIATGQDHLSKKLWGLLGGPS